jgi:hypothetical protein
MSTIEITARASTLIERSIFVKWDKFKAEGERIRHNQKCFERAVCSDDGEFYNQMNVLSATIRYEFNFNSYHDADCDTYQEDDIINYTDDCNCEKEVGYTIKIVKSDKTLFMRCFSKKHTTKEVVEAFGEMPVEFNLCQCGSVAVYSDSSRATTTNWCEDCFIWRQEHPNGGTEVCAICHEGEGRYMKTDCGHYFHSHCFGKIEWLKGQGLLKTCPLCRHKVELSKTLTCI